MTKCENAFSSTHSCKVGETMEEKHSSSLAAYGNEERTFCFLKNFLFQVFWNIFIIIIW